MTQNSELSDGQMTAALRALAMDAVQKANSGHPGMPMGMADAAFALYRDHLKFDASDVNWPDRDRLILSAGHGSMLLYGLLYLTGVESMPIDQIKNFRQLGSHTPGHPEYGDTPGVETTTGPLGQGLANAVGFALAERHLNAHFGDDLVDHHTYCIAGDGCLMEGISQEAITLAGHLKLNRLIVLFDDNAITIDGATNLSTSEDTRARFEAAGWETVGVDGHDVDAVSSAIDQAKGNDKPTLIACKTTIGFGAPTKAGLSKSHGSPLGDEEIAGAREALNWPHDPFVVPDDILSAWRDIGARGNKEHKAWQKRLDGDKKAKAFKDQLDGSLTDACKKALKDYRTQLLEERPKLASRAASGKALEVIMKHMPGMIGGSADLTGSNNTKTSLHSDLDAANYSGNYVNYGVREHGMAAAMNGLALHGGIVPYAGTFLVFSDYCRPSIRLSALMKQRVIYVMTHDSIGLGEDGPTHQPVEHLAALRTIPNLMVFRPCDAMEVAECWEIALSSQRPSVICLSRQGLPFVRMDDSENFSALGAYIYGIDGHSERQVSICASGSEVSLAIEAANRLRDEHSIEAAVVSMPCWELFGEQTDHYREEVLGVGTLRIGIEAAVPFGWGRWLGGDGVVVGMPGFGASAPADELYKHFGITVDAIIDAVKARI